MRTKVLITGANGFIGRNLCSRPRLAGRRRSCSLRHAKPRRMLDDGWRRRTSSSTWPASTGRRDRTNSSRECGLHGGDLRQRWRAGGASRPIVLASSIQAELDNPYGSVNEMPRRRCGGSADRLGARRGLPPEERLRQVVSAQLQLGDGHVLPQHRARPADPRSRTRARSWTSSTSTTWWRHSCGDPDALAAGGVSRGGATAVPRITLGRPGRADPVVPRHAKTLRLPDLAEPFIRALYATYLSYLATGASSPTALDIKTDARGSLAEFVKSPSFGRCSSRAPSPGVTRGQPLPPHEDGEVPGP